MKITISFKADNAAFEGMSQLDLAAWGLLATSRRVKAGLMAGRIKDNNGNTVGEFSCVDDDDEESER